MPSLCIDLNIHIQATWPAQAQLQDRCARDYRNAFFHSLNVTHVSLNKTIPFTDLRCFSITNSFNIQHTTDLKVIWIEPNR